ncbi:hypothetical protein EJ05DRAFT_498620 [Pseudovirgaria hyperparasitica]|uniref:Adenylyl cyclase-associated protein n=1 Tax=Pseudovirgaria hyperparasitica TaxID=470096 RepID=A0A6A6WD81_9PEZI|nr:uncharacterized protein EJ05DRAFT_498620 [Pseudovirgaria hyperparasitica]KAF2760663.1 hypothetical protein EJ05DRAFT_498620 [Pseudovirgaria hyperparasitica]
MPDRLSYRVTTPVTAGNTALTVLISRLEAATSRLEDIASSTFEQEGQRGSISTATPVTAIATTPATAKTPTAPAALSPPMISMLPPSVEGYNELIAGPKGVQAWKTQSAQLDPVLGEQAAAVVSAFEAQKQFLLVTTKAKKPDVASSKYMEVLRDLQGAIEKVDEVRQSHRASELKDHLSMVADGVGALGWVTVDSNPKPADYVSELFGGAQMYGNKVLKQKQPQHTEWVQAYYSIYKDLIAYVKKFYERGVPWNKDGIDAIEALKQVKAKDCSTVNGAVPAGGPPQPPPPPPLPTFDAIPPQLPPAPGASRGTAPTGDMGAVFDQLNKGSDVTKGLKKVDASQMTHKNPSLRTSSSVPQRSNSQSSLISRSKSPAPPGKKPKPESMRTKKPPRKELDGQKWIIENFESPDEMIEIEANLKQSVLITKCNKATIRIIGKANSISIDNSSRASLVIDTLVSSVDVIKCPNFALQVLGSLPTVLLDQVDGASIYLSKDSLSTEIFTSKCSSININIPPAQEDGDYTEHPTPEQIRTYIKNGQLVSEIVEHAG